MDNCPINQEACFPSCFFWRGEKCDYEKIVVETREEARKLSLSEDEMVKRFPHLFQD